MVKKIVLILLLSAYTLSVTGTGVAFHFCMGKFAGTSFWQSADKHDSGCGVCGMEKKKSSCCNDQQAYLKLTTDHQFVQNATFDFQQFEAILQNNFVSNISTFQLTPSPLLPSSNAPPNKGAVSLNILNRVFLI